MKPETEQLLATLEVLIEGLSFESESCESFRTFVSEKTDKDNFTITNYLRKINFFRPVEISVFLQEWQRKLPNHSLTSQMNEKYQLLIQLLQVYLAAIG